MTIVPNLQFYCFLIVYFEHPQIKIEKSRTLVKQITMLT